MKINTLFSAFSIFLRQLSMDCKQVISAHWIFVKIRNATKKFKYLHFLDEQISIIWSSRISKELVLFYWKRALGGNRQLVRSTDHLAQLLVSLHWYQWGLQRTSAHNPHWCDQRLHRSMMNLNPKSTSQDCYSQPWKTLMPFPWKQKPTVQQTVPYNNGISKPLQSPSLLWHNILHTFLGKQTANACLLQFLHRWKWVLGHTQMVQLTW